jgi:hypothetical protein
MGFAHPAQVVMDTNGNFVGVGTYKSKGTNAGIVNCPNHYDPADWTGYADHVTNGVYNCFPFCADCWQSGDNPSFQILYGYCPASMGNRWMMTFDGVLRACIAGPSVGRRAVAGLETHGHSQDQNIDVKWTNMAHRVQGAPSWAPCLGNTAPGYTDPSYSYQYVSNCAWNVYLAPLN